MTIAFIAGTTAELIKLSPVMHALTASGAKYELWNTAWHVDHFSATLGDLRLPTPDEQFVAVAKQRPVIATSQVPMWALRVLRHAVRHRRALRARLEADGRPPLLVVHGDTFTTVLGALIGRIIGVPVAHVEAGMRSGDWFNPLPEEVNRKVVARFARLHFAPTAHEVAHLRRERVRGRVVDTGANTAIDALREMMSEREPAVDLPEKFGLVTLHRFEMVRNAEVFTETLQVLAESSRTYPLVMPAGDAERARITELGLDGLFGDDFRLVPKQPYARFLPILGRASFVVTDSGGLQQECGILGMPCAIQREATESQQGLGENLLLTELDMDRLRGFLTDWESRRRPSQLDAFHPARIIVDCLAQEGHAPAPAR